MAGKDTTSYLALTVHYSVMSTITVPLELPVPELGNMSELHDLCMEVLRATRPTELGYSYEELKGMDDISVTIMPEKKGMVFKHVEYLVESRVSMMVCGMWL